MPADQSRGQCSVWVPAVPPPRANAEEGVNSPEHRVHSPRSRRASHRSSGRGWGGVERAVVSVVRRVAFTCQ